MSKKDEMDKVEVCGEGRNTFMILQEFKERFARLSALDRTECVLHVVRDKEKVRSPNQE